jgi:branched-chain amino acid transport system permease protein
VSYYVSLLAVYFVVYALGALAMNLQFGLAGIVNFALIIFEAAGAYAAALVTLGRPTALSGQTYFWGAHWPFPLPLIAATAAGGVLALILGPATMRRMRRDYQAAAMIVLALIANQVVTNDPGLLNGAEGLAGVPQPLAGSLGVNSTTYGWIYVVFALAVGAAIYWVLRRVSLAPFGRALRAVRDDETAAAAAGKSPWRLRMIAFVLGGAIAGLAGGILVEFIGGWSPSGWEYQETFVLLVAVLLGGIGNERGALLGAFLVGIVLLQLSTFLPPVGYPGLIDSLDWVIIGAAWLVVLWVRPRGLLPERTELGLVRLPAVNAIGHS